MFLTPLPGSTRVCVLGPPHSDVSSHANRIAEENELVYLTLSNMIQHFVDGDTLLGSRVTQYRTDHPDEPLSPDLIHTCIQTRVYEEDCASQGWVMDSFPQTVADIDFLNAIGSLPIHAIWMELGRETRRALTTADEKKSIQEFVRNRKLLERKFEQLGVLSLSVSGDDQTDLIAEAIDSQLRMVDVAEGPEEEDEGESESGESDDEDERPYAILHSHSIRTSAGPCGFVLTERYKNPVLVGGGAYGIVVRAHDDVLDTDVAIKKIGGLMTRYGGSTRRSYLTRIIREVYVLRHVRRKCPFVTPLLDLIPTSVDASSMKDLIFVMPWAGDNLWNMLHSFNGIRVSNNTTRKIMYQLLCGLKFLHSAGILHRDIKGGNICFDKKSGVVKLTDMGLSRGCDSVTSGDVLDEDPADAEARKMMSTVLVCTAWYRPPELILGDATASGAIDVWSLGCILAELLYPMNSDPDYDRKIIFRPPDLPTTATAKEIRLNQLGKIFQVLGTPDRHALCGRLSWIRQALEELGFSPRRDLADEFPSTTDPHALDLLREMLLINPADRISVDSALAHRYFRDIRVPDLELTCPRFTFRKDMIRMKYRKRSLTSKILRLFLFDIVKKWNVVRWGYTEDPRFDDE